MVLKCHSGILLEILPTHCVLLSIVCIPMALVIRIEPNGSQTLLLCDDAREDLEGQGWLVFLEKFQGFNLQTA